MSEIFGNFCVFFKQETPESDPIDKLDYSYIGDQSIRVNELDDNHMLNILNALYDNEAAIDDENENFDCDLAGASLCSVTFIFHFWLVDLFPKLVA